MSYERIKGEFVFTCDDCQVEYIETGEKTWEDALEYMKGGPSAKGWELIREDGEFKNYCPECSQQH